MISFLKHVFTRKEKLLVRQNIIRLGVGLSVGIVLAGWLLLWQGHQDAARIVDLKQQATVAVAEPSPVPPQSGKLGGSFTLTNQDGHTVTDHDFAGQYLLVYFGYTSCPDMCPTGLESISRALDQLKQDADKVQPLFITVDPPRDTPQRLKEYDSAFHSKIVGLTGTAQQIAEITKKYQVYYQKGEGDVDYEVEHSSLIYLMSPSGELLTTFDEEVDPKLIVAALHKAWGSSAATTQP